MEFLEIFKESKKYIFDKDIYIEWRANVEIEDSNPKAEEQWTTICNNKEIERTDSNNGKITVSNITFGVIPKWCREVPSPIRILTDKDL